MSINESRVRLMVFGRRLKIPCNKNILFVTRTLTRTFYMLRRTSFVTFYAKCLIYNDSFEIDKSLLTVINARRITDGTVLKSSIFLYFDTNT